MSDRRPRQKQVGVLGAAVGAGLQLGLGRVASGTGRGDARGGGDEPHVARPAGGAFDRPVGPCIRAISKPPRSHPQHGQAG